MLISNKKKQIYNINTHKLIHNSYKFANKIIKMVSLKFLDGIENHNEDSIHTIENSFY